VLLDLNDPLAGTTVHVAVRVMGIDGPEAPSPLYARTHVK
jgi:FKBP-type peptidyl-prolyl cis-trans isomerase 2